MLSPPEPRIKYASPVFRSLPCRSRGLQVALSDDEALKGMVPPAMRWLFKLGALGMALIRSQVHALVKKYPKQYDEEELKAALAKISTGIESSSSGYLVGDALSFAGALLPLLQSSTCEVFHSLSSFVSCLVGMP